jgi:A/G-specific adenine glycosylase
MEAFPRSHPGARSAGICFLMLDGRGASPRKRRDGIGGGQVPTSDWLGEAFGRRGRQSGASESEMAEAGRQRHPCLHPFACTSPCCATSVKADPRYRWVEIDNLDKVALPSVMRKVVEHGLGSWCENLGFHAPAGHPQFLCD